ncbi:MAG: hypothetical protein HC853_12460 [Anaerolineae bacterium]|nr:hypothetical protein [Anaerolineae bacterium]
MLLAALLLVLVVLMGLMRVGGLSEAISPMPPRASDPAPQRGAVQESSVRDALREEGYEQPFGTSDIEIRANLGMRGKIADFVGYHRETGRWLVAESKGGNIQDAFNQLSNTQKALSTKEPGSLGVTDLRLYLKPDQYAKLVSEPANIAGWRVQNGVLGWLEDKTKEWVFAEINGIRVFVFAAP